MALFSHVLGIIAIIAVLVDRKVDKRYSFYILQALLLNLVCLLLMMPFYFFFLPNYILSLDIAIRTSTFLKLTLIPVSLLYLALIISGVMSYMEIQFKIPFIGDLALKLSGYESQPMSSRENRNPDS